MDVVVGSAQHCMLSASGACSASAGTSCDVLRSPRDRAPMPYNAGRRDTVMHARNIGEVCQQPNEAVVIRTANITSCAQRPTAAPRWALHPNTIQIMRPSPAAGDERQQMQGVTAIGSGGHLCCMLQSDALLATEMQWSGLISRRPADTLFAH